MRFLAPLLFFVMALTAQAQFQVGLTLPRTNFLALEAIPATVTVTNRTGADVVLGGPGRASWLSFEMTDRTGRSLAPMEVDSSEITQIPPGGTVQKRIMVTDAYAPTEIGNYGLTARVNMTSSSDYFASTRVRFNITDSKPIWQQAYGVPTGYKNAGAERRYAIIHFTDVESTSLYVRIMNDLNNEIIGTIQLGPVVMVLDPQITLDKGNRLHVLFLAQPRIYAHCIVNPDGTVAKRSYYREDNGDRPVLATNSGDVQIRGGIFFDPNKPAAPASKDSGRKVSEKPPGL